MKIIVGLGNPGEKYEGTRHNSGFVFIDKLSCHKNIAAVDSCNTFSYDKKSNALVSETNVNGEKVILVKPQTFMNLSGLSVMAITSFLKVESSDLIVVSDDIDLPIGQARVRNNGGSGGQKGLQNIIDVLKEDNFTRIRLGIGPLKPEENKIIETADYVLSRFTDREKYIFNEVTDLAVEYLVPYLGLKNPIPAHTLTVAVDSL